MTSDLPVIPDAKRSGTEIIYDANPLLGCGAALRSGQDDNWEIA